MAFSNAEICTQRRMHNEELHLYSLPNITQVIKSNGEKGRSFGMHRSERLCRWKYIILKCDFRCRMAVL
jgi:hypothetical protein